MALHIILVKKRRQVAIAMQNSEYFNWAFRRIINNQYEYTDQNLTGSWVRSSRMRPAPGERLKNTKVLVILLVVDFATRWPASLVK